MPKALTIGILNAWHPHWRRHCLFETKEIHINGFDVLILKELQPKACGEGADAGLAATAAGLGDDFPSQNGFGIHRPNANVSPLSQCKVCKGIRKKLMPELSHWSLGHHGRSQENRPEISEMVWSRARNKPGKWPAKKAALQGELLEVPENWRTAKHQTRLRVPNTPRTLYHCDPCQSSHPMSEFEQNAFAAVSLKSKPALLNILFPEFPEPN